MATNRLKAIPLGGLGEIGMNCMALEYQDQMIVIDCGILFSDLDHLGVDFVIPDFSYLQENRDNIQAFVITHGHEDHIGAIPFAIKAGLSGPFYAPPFTTRQIEAKLKDYEIDDPVELKTYEVGETLDLGAFQVETIHVNHSIVDAAGLIIHTPLGKIVHTGDFKIDREPYYGKAIALDRLREVGEEGVLALLSDSTNVEKQESGVSEKEVHENLFELLSGAKGLDVVALFSSNIARLRQVFEIAYRQGKKVALSGRSLQQNVELAHQAGFLEYVDETLISLNEIEEFPRDQVMMLVTGSQGEFRAALFRISRGEHRQVKLEEGDRVLFSSKFIPGNEKDIGRLINNLFRQGADVIYGSEHRIHASGHASRSELKEIMETVRPRFFMPVHGEYRHLIHHARLAQEAEIPEQNTVVASDGDVVAITPDKIEIVDQFEETRVLVEGRDGKDVSKLLIRDRRQLGEKGVVIALLVRNDKNREIITEPEIIARGLAHEDSQPELMEEAKKLVQDRIDEYQRLLDEGYEEDDLQERVRIELRRFFNRTIGKKPIVLPVLLGV